MHNRGSMRYWKTQSDCDSRSEFIPWCHSVANPSTLPLRVQVWIKTLLIETKTSLPTFCLLKSIHTLHRSHRLLCVIQNFLVEFLFSFPVIFKINSLVQEDNYCTILWWYLNYTIFHRYTCVLHPWNLPPTSTSSPHPSRLSWNTGFGCPTSCTECTLVICLIYMVMSCISRAILSQTSLSLPHLHWATASNPTTGISSRKPETEQDTCIDVHCMLPIS